MARARTHENDYFRSAHYLGCYNEPSLVCGEHFNKTGHSQLDMLPILEEVTHKNDDFLGLEREKIWIRNYHTTNILEPFFILFANCSFFKKGLITFHFSKNMFSFSKWVSE